jgi:hypothetical protein
LRFPSWLRLPLAQEGILICFSPLFKGKVRDASASAQIEHKGEKWVFSELKNEPILSIFIIPLPVYSHTAFLDDFFLRSFPYTQAEATRIFRTRGEISPLSKATARVCAEISTCFIRRVPDPRRVLKGALRAVTASWGCTRLVQYSGKSF